jgi:hypothetical protein
MIQYKKHSTNNKKHSKYKYYILPKHPHITKEVKINTVQDTPKWNSHNMIKYPQCKVILMYTYEGGPKNNRNLNVARELEVVAPCAARCRESTQYSSSLPVGVSLGWVLLLLCHFF